MIFIAAPSAGRRRVRAVVSGVDAMQGVAAPSADLRRRCSSSKICSTRLQVRHIGHGGAEIDQPFSESPALVGAARQRARSCSGR